jgi:hypothetical protein
VSAILPPAHVETAVKRALLGCFRGRRDVALGGTMAGASMKRRPFRYAARMSGPDLSRGSEPDAGLVREFLRARDVPCPGCGYNLRGIPEPRCPECERAVTLGIEGEWGQPRQRVEAVVLLWIIFVASLGILGVWVTGGLSWVSVLPAWMVGVVFATIGVAAVEVAATLRLIAAMRRPRGPADRASALKWALIWLTVHAVGVCMSLASNVFWRLQ